MHPFGKSTCWEKLTHRYCGQELGSCIRFAGNKMSSSPILGSSWLHCSEIEIVLASDPVVPGCQWGRRSSRWSTWASAACACSPSDPATPPPASRGGRSPRLEVGTTEIGYGINARLGWLCDGYFILFRLVIWSAIGTTRSICRSS